MSVNNVEQGALSELVVNRWLAFAAMKVAAEVLAITATAPAAVRELIQHPSEVDLALVTRVANLLGPRVARLDPQIPEFDFPAI